MTETAKPETEGQDQGVGAKDGLAEVLFYHLERQPLEDVLPALLEKTLQRGWRAVVQSGTRERVDALDLSLWTYRDDSFLPHAIAGDGPDQDQPILLTTESATENGAGIRFLVDGAEAESFEGFARIVYLFDGADDNAIGLARREWKEAKAAGCTVTYWQQAPNGAWQKKA